MAVVAIISAGHLQGTFQGQDCLGTACIMPEPKRAHQRKESERQGKEVPVWQNPRRQKCGPASAPAPGAWAAGCAPDPLPAVPVSSPPWPRLCTTQLGTGGMDTSPSPGYVPCLLFMRGCRASEQQPQIGRPVHGCAAAATAKAHMDLLQLVSFGPSRLRHHPTSHFLPWSGQAQPGKAVQSRADLDGSTASHPKQTQR